MAYSEKLAEQTRKLLAKHKVLRPCIIPSESLAEKEMMRNKYFEEVTGLLKQARPGLAATHQLTFKIVFGAVAGYIDGRIFISCGKFGVALRLPPNALDDLFKQDGVKRLKYFPRGHIKKEYAVLPERILDDQHRFGKLVDQSIKYLLL